MAGIEDLVRDSLRQRAQDVEPTPALWLEVDRRVTRRRRFRVATWSLAGVAAALAAVAIVPGLLPGGPGTGLQIDPMDRLPAAGVVPSVAVVADGGELSLVELSGDREPTVLFEGDGEIVQVAVRPGSSASDHDIAAVRIADDGVAELLFASSVAGDDSRVEGRMPEHAVSPGFVPTVAWGPQGQQLLYTIPADADGAIVVVQDVRPADGTYLDASRGTELAVIDNTARVLDWVGASNEVADDSRVYLRGADGRVTFLELSTGEDGDLVLDDTGTVTPSLAGITGLAFSHRGDAPDQPAFLLGGDGAPVLGWAGGGDLGDPGFVTVPLAEVVGEDLAAADLWLSAKQDAALIGDGERLWLLAHDGAGAFGPAVELSVRGTLGALFDAVRPGDGDEPADDTGADPDPSTDTDATEGAEPGAVAELPAPIVTVGFASRELVLHAPGGPVVLATLTEEGESRFVSVRVRPGSTLDDLTLVALTTAEGMYDLRHLHLVEGEVVTWEPFPQPYTPGFGGNAGSGVSIWGPLWSPDGEHLAWFEFGTGPATLRTIGWDAGPGTGEPATDNALFTLEDLPTQPIIPMEWISVPGEATLTEIRAASGDLDGGWFAVPLEVQGDGALAQPAGSRGWELRPGAPGTTTIHAVAGTTGAAGAPRFLIQVGATGFELVIDPYGDQRRIALPDEFGPGDTIPEFWLRPIGEGVLVGSPNTSVAWYVPADGPLFRVPGEVTAADVVE
jgi:hypothetical protein